MMFGFDVITRSHKTGEIIGYCVEWCRRWHTYDADQKPNDNSASFDTMVQARAHLDQIEEAANR